MGIKEANIYLDNQYNTYYAGQTVNGRIEYVFDSPKKVRGIHVKFKGAAHTEWLESKEEMSSQQRGLEFKNEPMDQNQISNRMTGDEEYFTIQYYVLGSNSGSEIEIPSGKQSYNFTCALPPVLPSSFEGEFGYVRYTVAVTLDRPWKFDQETKMAFTVINALDLNLNPSYKDPIHMQLEKTFCCLCCVSAPLSVDVRAPVSGYCPGQAIPVQVAVENNSNVQVHLIKLMLRKIVTYRATSPAGTKKCKDIVHTIQEGPAPAGSSKQWSLSLEVPPIPPSNLVNCSIIDLDYDLKVECVVSGMHMNLSAKKYVTIGTVPLLGALPSPPSPAVPPSPSQPAVLPVQPGQPAQPSAPSAGDMPAGWVSPGGPPPQAPYQALYPTLSEPVYKASPYGAQFGIRDSAHTRLAGQQQFAPTYPTYHTQPPPLPH